MKLKVHEIFPSISGEVGSIPQGAWTTFIRLDGCNLKCWYCDTKITQEGNHHKEMETKEILEKINEIGCENILITGGEPLHQMEGVEKLIDDFFELSEEWFLTSIESNGSIFPTDDITNLADSIVFDYKLPSTGYTDLMMPVKQWEELKEVEANIYIKFVCGNITDYNKAKEFMETMGNDFHYAFSAVSSSLPYSTLFEWMKRDRLYNAMFNVQIHKLADLNEKPITETSQ